MIRTAELKPNFFPIFLLSSFTLLGGRGLIRKVGKQEWERSEISNLRFEIACKAAGSVAVLLPLVRWLCDWF